MITVWAIVILQTIVFNHQSFTGHVVQPPTQSTDVSTDFPMENMSPQIVPEKTQMDNPQTVLQQPMRSRYGRGIKPKREEDFVYVVL